MKADQEIKGVYNTHRWASEDGNYMIATLQDGTTIVGSAKPDQFVQGMEYRIAGRWETHPDFGEQFRFSTFIATTPTSESAVMAYLGTFIFSKGFGIGPVKARKVIASETAQRTLETLKCNPERTVQITGISLEKAKGVAEALIQVEKFESTRMELVQLFKGRGFSQECIERAIEDFGVCAAQHIKRDPFTMLVRKYQSAGFLRCDQLYRDLGLNQARLKRQVICLWHQLQQGNGSVWLSATEAVGELRRLISSNANPKKAMRLGVRAKWLASKRDRENRLWIAVRDDAMNERFLAKKVKELKDGTTYDQPEGSGESTGRIKV